MDHTASASSGDTVTGSFKQTIYPFFVEIYCKWTYFAKELKDLNN